MELIVAGLIVLLVANLVAWLVVACWPAKQRTVRRGRKTQLIPVIVACDCDGCEMTTSIRCPRCNDETDVNPPKICRRCRSDPFPTDTYVRGCGWRIKHRPKYGPAIWTDAASVYGAGRELTIDGVIGDIEALR